MQFEEFNPEKLKRSSIKDRKNKVGIDDFAKVPAASFHALDFIDSFPNILAGKDFKFAIEAIAEARESGYPTAVSMGAHVIKCGLSPLICTMIREGIITSIAMNGAGAIHDTEIALFGVTSEDVVDSLKDGSFGMAYETADFINGAISKGVAAGMGIGQSVGTCLINSSAPNKNLSILAAAVECGIPITVHIALGTDIIHMHPSADGASYGEGSMRDFRIITKVIEKAAKGVIWNIGSAVVLPEVILKAVAIGRNQGIDFSGCTGVNFDFNQQYRSTQQVIVRLISLGGKGAAITGHHEILIPLAASALLERLGKR